ncbi:flagellar assembly protein FliW [Anaeromicropila herbilytica]|uniref:Flagellar assembly factor FliW n=1 Tax=Anaeromicropila herbilytica TaxID=2785025 RepID=A0A7R7IFZ5_9FIRM|nr:flagellar assembly protein FliW [Anaeromicropila herbilytica]BCN32558.1 flagellar assembly factor FliW [Anaeromicropila herbilytica]
MLVKTKGFGEIDLNEDKIITFDNGIMGFEDYKKYTILYNIENESEKGNTISWLQSIEEPALALPVINPLLVKEDYNPTVNDDVLKPLGELTDDNLLVLLSITVPSDLEKMTANLKAPFIINSDSKKACQIIVENQDYEVKYPIYETIKKLKEKKGE